MQIETINIDEFAKRMGVSRTTVFKWKNNGILKSGVHFIQVGSVIRFFWDINVLRTIKSEECETEEKQVSEIKRPAPTRKASINMDY